MKMDEPIINSLLDTDVYKASCSRLAYSDVGGLWNRGVRYKFINRTSSVPLARHIPPVALQRQVDEICKLRFQPDEIDFISTIHPALSDSGYRAALADVRLPRVIVSEVDGQLDLAIEGVWGATTWLEIPLLAAINEMYVRSIVGDDLPFVLARGISKVHNKTTLLGKYPELRFSWFATRRRAFREWERIVFESFVEAIPEQMVSCSNMWLAKEFGWKAGGTMPHEVIMMFAALAAMDGDNTLLNAQNQLYDTWWELFGGPLSIALSDTFGSKHFFRTFDENRSQKFWGARQDSGDPFWWGEAYIQMLQSFGVNPRGKMALFSDGLTPKDMVALFLHFHRRVDVGFGPGTNLSFDLGIKPLSIVIKLSEVMDDEGRWVSAVKLSDNPAKAIGTPDEVARYMRVFQYEPGETVQPRY